MSDIDLLPTASTADEGTRFAASPQGVLDVMRALVARLRGDPDERLMSLDLTVPQWRAFFAVAKDPGQPIGVVGRRLGIGLPAASHLVDRLVRAGLVARVPHPEDRRQVLCHLTPEGEALFQELSAAGVRRVQRWLELLPAQDLAALAQGLSALARVAEADRAQTKEEEVR